MTSSPKTHAPLSALDRPNSYIGKVVPRPNLDRLMQGRGLYVSDLDLPRMAHVVFVRTRKLLRSRRARLGRCRA
jgi:aerobic carbon-monoxide dehydrogenase large subunit